MTDAALHPGPGLPRLQNGDRLDQPTFHARYEAMPHEFRAELISGIVRVRPRRSTATEGSARANLIGWLGTYNSRTPQVDGLAHVTLILGPDSEPQPDACLLIDGGQTRENDEGYLVGSPELVAEVASTETGQVAERQAMYERYGVSEYLVVVIDAKRVLWLTRRPGNPGAGFVELQPSADGILRSSLFSGLWLDPAAILRDDAKRVFEVLELGLATAEHAVFAAR